MRDHPLLLATAKRVGLSDGKRSVADSDDDLVLVFDLALHTAPRGRRRAINRYAASHHLGGGGGRAGGAARHPLLAVPRQRQTPPRPGSGWRTGGEVWLVDVNLEGTARPGAVLAMRLATPDAFAISCGVALPIDEDTLDEILDVLSDGGEIDNLAPLADEPRLAQSVYQLALELGLTASVSYR